MFVTTTLFLTDQINGVVVTPFFLSMLRSLYSEAVVENTKAISLRFVNVSNKDFVICFAAIFCLPIHTTKPKVHLTQCFLAYVSILQTL